MAELVLPLERRMFWIAAVVAVLMSFTGWSLYVDQLLVTFLHESSHGLMAMLTGGHVASFSIAPNTSGLCYTIGGFRPFVLMAGYVGGCAWGGAMLVASRMRGVARPVLTALAVFMIGFTILYGRSFMALAVGLGWGAFFGWAAFHGRNWQLSLLLAFLAVRNCLNAVDDVRQLIWISGSHYGVMTDAQLMSTELFHGWIGALPCALVIALFSFVVLGGFGLLAFRPKLLR